MSMSIQEKRKVAKIVLVVSIISLLILGVFSILSPNNASDESPSIKEGTTFKDVKKKISHENSERSNTLTELKAQNQSLLTKIENINDFKDNTRSQMIVGGIVSLVLGLLLSTVFFYKVEKRDIFSK